MELKRGESPVVPMVIPLHPLPGQWEANPEHEKVERVQPVCACRCNKRKTEKPVRLEIPVGMAACP